MVIEMRACPSAVSGADPQIGSAASGTAVAFGDMEWFEDAAFIRPEACES